MWQHVGHGDQNGQAGTPAGRPVGRAEFDADPDEIGRSHAGFDQAEYRLSNNQRQSILETVAEAPP